jgi:type II secretory pathway component PulF
VLFKFKHAFEKFADKTGLTEIYLGLFDRCLDIADQLGLVVAFEDAFAAIKLKFIAPEHEQVSFIKVFNQFIQDGVRPHTACEQIVLAANKSGPANNYKAKVASAMKNSLIRGKDITEGIEGYFSQDLLVLFRIGWQTGRLGDLMEHFLADRDALKDVKKVAFSRLFMPALYFFGMLGLFFVIGRFGIPAIPSGVDLTKLPTFTLWAMNFATFMSHWGFLVLLMIVALRVGFLWVRDNAYGAWRERLNKVWPFSIHTELMGMTFMKNIALLNRTSLSLDRICQTLQRSSAPFLRPYYAKVRSKLANKEMSIAEYLDVGLLNPWVLAQVHAIAQTKGDESKIKAIHSAGEKSGIAALNMIEGLARSVSPLLFFSSALLVLLFALGLVTGLLNLDKIIQVR